MTIHRISKEAVVRAKHFFVFLTTAESRVKIWRPFEGGGSVGVDSLAIVAHIGCGYFVFGPCFVVQYLVSFLVLQSSC